MENKVKHHKNELSFYLEPGEDPMNRLGFGLTYYFDMIKMLMFALFVMSLINTPLFMVYSRYQVTSDEWGGLTLGALG